MDILEIQQYFKKRYHDLVWEREDRIFRWQEFLANAPESRPLPLSRFRECFSTDHGFFPQGVGFYEFSSLPMSKQALIGDRFTDISSQSKLDAFQQAQTKNNFVTVFPPNGNFDLTFHHTLFAGWPNVFFLIERGSSLRLKINEIWDEKSPGASSIFFFLEKGSHTECLVKNQAGGMKQSFYHASIGQGSSFSMYYMLRSVSPQHLGISVMDQGNVSCAKLIFGGEFLADSKNIVKIRSKSEHASGKTVIHARVVGDGESYAILDGLASIGKKAKGASVFLKEDVLLVSEKARIKTDPMLEILQSDVSAKHSAAIGKLSAEALYYLMSRGIPKDAARNLLKHAFLRSLLPLIDDAGFREEFLD